MIVEFRCMENDTIYLSEALKIIQLKDSSNKRVPFDLQYRTFNSQTSKGGKLKTYLRARYLPEANPNAQPSKSLEAILAPEKPSRNPAHYKNRTRNIELENGEIVTIRIDFIDSINNRKVIY